jgi:hypothetical protein
LASVSALAFALSLLALSALTVTKLREQETAPELVMVVPSPVEREFGEINRRTEVDARWTDEGVERIAKLLEEVRINGKRL